MVTIKLSPLTNPTTDLHEAIQLSFHSSIFEVYAKLQKWQTRFPILRNDLILNELTLFYSLAKKRYLEHRSVSHLSRLILSIHFMLKSLQQSLASSTGSRQLKIQWIPGRLSFPFVSKAVLGCLVGLTLSDRYEVFDEHNILLILEKKHPELKIVQDSYYYHATSNKRMNILYFEIEKSGGTSFSLQERAVLKQELEQHIGSSIQKLAPMVFMRRNEEEVYKMILTLSREMSSIDDLPQAWITFEHQTAEESVFLIILVSTALKNCALLTDYFAGSEGCRLVLERDTTVKYLQEQPIGAQIFRIHLQRKPSFVRSDGSLDFYACRQKVVSLLNAATGEFRDFNGGSLIKQSELLNAFKTYFPSSALNESELMDTFFYGITPLEKQSLLSCRTIAGLFHHFLDMRRTRVGAKTPYAMEVRRGPNETFVAVHAHDPSWREVILRMIEQHSSEGGQLTYTMIDTPQGLFFHGVLVLQHSNMALIEALQEALHHRHASLKKRQVLRIGSQYALFSLDPRVGGDAQSSDILRLLFQGLTRMGKNGLIENAIADSVDVSSDYTCYTFKLRRAQWNDGSYVKAHDFAYSWKKVLSPDFKTAFAYLFDNIKYAKEAKQGKVSVDQVGIRCLDDQTLQVELTHPTPYFLELTAMPIYFPVHREMDTKLPQWPYQVGSNYPCNGPFQLAINDPHHQTYQLVRNPFYWDASSVELDEVLLTRTNPQSAFVAFQKGELDWIGDTLGEWHSFYKERPEDKKIICPDALTCWLVFNTTHPPFHHPKIRQAFGVAIDREALIASSFIPLNPGYSFIPSESPPRHPPLFPKQDIEQARALFEEGLQELQLSRRQLPCFRLTYCQGSIREGIALRLKNQLEEVLDIVCELQPLHWNAVVSKMTSDDFQIGLVHWLVYIKDPIATLNVFRYADEGINFPKWNDPIFRNWLEMSDHEVCQTLRSCYLTRAEERLCNQMPIIPLYFKPHIALVRKGLQIPYHLSFQLERSSYDTEKE